MDSNLNMLLNNLLTQITQTSGKVDEITATMVRREDFQRFIDQTDSMVKSVETEAQTQRAEIDTIRVATENSTRWINRFNTSLMWTVRVTIIAILTAGATFIFSAYQAHSGLAKPAAIVAPHLDP